MNALKNAKKSIWLKGIVLSLLCLTCLIGCASVPTEERFSLVSPAKEILANNKFVIVSVSTMHEYVPSGDAEMDGYLNKNPEIWQKEIAECLRKKLGEKGINAIEITQPSSADFKDKLQSLLKKNGRDGFINPNTGKFDEELYKSVMLQLPGEYNANVVIPKLIIKTAGFRSLGVLDAPDAKWDGVSRNVETGGGKAMRFLAGFGGDKTSSGTVGVLSLHLEIYNSKGLAYWANGGFDIKSRVGASGGSVKRENAEIFSSKSSKERIQESVNMVFEPLISQL